MLLQLFGGEVSESEYIAVKMIPLTVIFQPKWLKSENSVVLKYFFC